MLAIFIVTILLALIVLFRLRYQGKLSVLKTKILKRYVLYLFLYFFQLISFTLQLFSKSIIGSFSQEKTQKRLTSIFSIVVGFSFFVPIVPIIFLFTCEPFVYYDVRQQVRSVLKMKPDYQETKYSHRSLNAFLSSHMNAKYVATILVGILSKMT